MSGFNVIVASPSTGNCKSAYAFSLARLVAYFAQVRVFPEIESQQMDFDSIEGSSIAANRDKLVDRFLAKPDATHLLFVDEDMIFAPDLLHILARRRQPIVGCNYRMRQPPAPFTALNLARMARIETTRESVGLEPAAYTGFGFCLIERRVFEAVAVPRFLAVFTDHYSTEDSPFFAKATEAGFTCFVDHDASKGIAHRGDFVYRWDGDYAQLGGPNG
jgi:hypothetical protein